MVLFPLTRGSPPGGAGAHTHPESEIDADGILGRVADAETWAGLQTFNAGIKLAAAQQVQDSGGTGRFLPATTSPYVTLTGNTQISGGHLGVDWVPNAVSTIILALPTLSLSAGIYSTIQFAAQVATISGDSVWLTGLVATPVIVAGAGTSGAVLNALDFLTGINNAGNISSISGVKSALRLFVYTGTVTDWQSVDCPAMIVTLGDPTITHSHGVRIRNQGITGVETVVGLKIEPQTGADYNYLMVAERSTGNPSFAILAGDPAVDLSQVFIAVNNGAVVNRRIEIGAADSAGAGYRTLRVAN